MKDQQLSEKWNTFSGREYIGKLCDYLENQQSSEYTINTYKQRLVYFEKFLSKRPETLETATLETLTDYQAWLMVYRSRRGELLTVGTQIGLLHAIKVFYKIMEKLHLILNDPAQHLKIPQPPKKLLVSLLTANQASRLFKQPDLNTFNGYRDRTILEILYSCAPRILELRQLKETDVDLRTKSLRIYGKGNKTRIVPIGQNALSFLTVYLEEVRPLLLKEKTELLFVNRFGQEFGTSGMLKKIKNYAKSARIKKNITVHTFRHTLATEMLRKGCELSYIQRILGHESLTTTQQYTHIVKDELKKVQSTYHPREALELPQGSIKYEGLDQ